MPKRNKICIDMHVHTEHSADCRTTLSEIVAQIKEKDMAIAVADHNEMQGSIKAAKMAPDRVIPGIEVTCAEGFDILIYFYSTSDLKKFYNTNIAGKRKSNMLGSSKLKGMQIIKAARNYRCKIAFAHPYRPNFIRMVYFLFRMDTVREMLRAVDLIEGINGRSPRFLNKMAVRTAHRLGKNLVAGSDSHSLRRIGLASVCVDRNKKGSRGLLDAITKGTPRIKWEEKKIFV
ncbi:PHP domain-containing protein [Candidatus Woesearchaeota archaeon]|nr:PHP domain-containing protein [Candidatus Woesearchaeota archaeon]